MVSVDKIEQGIANYLDAELMPKLPKTGIERVVVGTAAALLIRRAGAIVEEYKDNKLVKLLGIIDKEGNVDMDALTEELKKNISKDGIVIDIPIVGILTFREEDVNKLYDYIIGVME